MRAALFACGALIASACSKNSPAEPSLHDEPALTNSPGVRLQADRCIKPTPKTPPPPVATGPDPACPADDLAEPPKLPVIALRFPDANALLPAVELTRTTAERARGLMFRTNMAEEHGMLFRMGARRVHNFWMENTCIPLDMIFIDDDGLIVGIYENAPTLTQDERGVGCPSSWVLEVNAGWSRRHAVVAGQRVEIPREATL